MDPELPAFRLPGQPVGRAIGLVGPALERGVERRPLEREAVALTVFSERLYLVTAEGDPFKELAPGDPADYPIITGVSVEGLSRDRARELDRVRWPKAP